MKHFGTETIKTERLTLRRFEVTDADMMFNNWASDDEVTRYMRWQSYKSVDEAKTTLQTWVENYENDNYYHWGICLENNVMIGSIGVYIDSEHDHRAGLGYCIGRNWWNKGYMSEAVKAVIDYMYTNTDVQRLEAFHAIENPASGRVMHKAGMEWEGLARSKFKSRTGNFEDSDEYGITREMWEVQNEIIYYNSLPCVFDGFIDVPELSDGEIYLICLEKQLGDPEKNHVPGYEFLICKGNDKVGRINLRIGYGGGLFNCNLYYGGQIGYDIGEPHRGNGYAGRACRLVIPVAKAHGMTKLLITTNYTNKSSMRVCEKLGARLIRTVQLPEWNDMYKDGQRFQNIYEMEI